MTIVLSPSPTPQMVNMGPTEILLVLLVLVLLFGAKKLPELARGSGRALRIFKSETRGLLDDEAEDTDTPSRRAEPPQIRPARVEQVQPTDREADVWPPANHLIERT